MFVKSEFNKKHGNSNEYFPTEKTLVYHWESGRTISDVYDRMNNAFKNTIDEDGAVLYCKCPRTAMDKIRDEARKWRKRGIQLQTLVRNQWDLDYENLKKDLNDIAAAIREEREAA